MQRKSGASPSLILRSSALLGRTFVLFLAIFLGLPEGNALGASQAIGKVRFTWDAIPEPVVSGYRVHWGTEPGVYTHTFDAGDVTEVEIQDFAEGITYYSAITAYSDLDEESDYSDEIAFVWTEEAIGGDSPIFQITSLDLDLEGQISIEFTGHNDLSSLDVQASNDLINWTSLGIATPANGTIQIVDPLAVDLPRRFYRLAASLSDP